MITGTNDAKLPPFPRDSKAPLDTPPAYSERATPAPAPRETHAPTPRTPPRAREAFTAAAPPPPPVPSASFPPAAWQVAPQQQVTSTPSWPAAPPMSAPSSPPADASSYEGSATSTSTSTSKGKGKGTGAGAGTKVARAVGQGMFALVAMPVVATAAALYGSGKLVEGIGRGLSAGPEAVLRACRRVDGKIKGEAGGGNGALGGDAMEEAREREWHRYQQQQHHQQQQTYPQQQQQYQYQDGYPYEQGEGVVGRSTSMAMEEGLKPRAGSRGAEGGLTMPMKGSLMEDPSIGMNGGSGSVRLKK